MTAQTVEVVGVPAEVAGALAALAARDGILTAEAVVEAARRPESPLHGYFEWDRDAAAAQYLLRQAEGLIRRVHVRVVSSPTEVVRARAYIARRDLPPDGPDDAKPGAYVPLTEVVRRGTTFEQALEEQVRRDLLRMQAKYRDLGLVLRVLEGLID